jgi:hypothetical protein
VGVHYTRGVRLRRHLADAGIGLAVGIPLAVLGWLVTLWLQVN